MSAWVDLAWADLGAAVAAGLLLCELNLLLASAVLHRGMAHRAISYPGWLQRAVCVWIWLTVFTRPLSWIASHRHHHAHADGADDPHAPGLKGVWKVSLLSWHYVIAWTEANRAFAAARYLGDFRNERLLRCLDRKPITDANFYGQLGLSLLHPVALGFLAGRLLPYLLSIGYMNAAGHTLGTRPFDNLGTDARGWWQKLAAYMLAGEPLGHNYHHRFPIQPNVYPRPPRSRPLVRDPHPARCPRARCRQSG